MLKKLLIGAAALATTASLGFAPSAQAACNDGSANQTDPAAENDDVAVTPNGTTIYGNDPQDDGAGYIGASGTTGYIELEGNDSPVLTLDGASSGGEVNGNVGTGGACVNDTRP